MERYLIQNQAGFVLKDKSFSDSDTVSTQNEDKETIDKYLFEREEWNDQEWMYFNKLVAGTALTDNGDKLTVKNVNAERQTLNLET